MADAQRIPIEIRWNFGNRLCPFSSPTRRAYHKRENGMLKPKRIRERLMKEELKIFQKEFRGRIKRPREDRIGELSNRDLAILLMMKFVKDPNASKLLGRLSKLAKDIPENPNIPRLLSAIEKIMRQNSISLHSRTNTICEKMKTFVIPWAKRINEMSARNNEKLMTEAFKRVLNATPYSHEATNMMYFCTNVEFPYGKSAAEYLTLIMVLY